MTYRLKLRKRTSGTLILIKTPEGDVKEFETKQEAFNRGTELVATGLWGKPITIEKIKEPENEQVETA